MYEAEAREIRASTTGGIRTVPGKRCEVSLDTITEMRNLGLQLSSYWHSLKVASFLTIILF